MISISNKKIPFNPALPATATMPASPKKEKKAPPAPPLLSPEDAHFEVIEVTPALAQEWLSSNDHGQRTVRKGTIETYASEMAKGNWKLLPEMIIFNEEGKLVNGQHRLHAVIKANVPIRLWIASAPGVQVSDSLDRGLQRRVSDLLGWTTSKAATAAALYRLQSMEFDNARITKDDTLAAYAAAKEDFDALYEKSNRTFAPASVQAALIFARPVNLEAVDDFNAALRSGANLKVGDPVLTFRNWLMSVNNSDRSSRRRTSDSMIVAFACLGACWAAIQNRPLLKMHIGPTAYREIVSRRRSMDISATPTVDQLPQGTASAMLFPKRLAGKQVGT